MARYDLVKLYKKVYSINQKYAIDLFFNYLNTRIEEVDDHDKKELLDHDWYEIFEFLLDKLNIGILQRLLASIQKLSDKFKKEHYKKEFFITDTIFDYSMWQHENLYTVWSLYLKTLKRVFILAQREKISFLELIEPYRKTNYISLIAFLTFGYSKEPKEYKNEILELFTNVKLLEELSFNQDDGYEFLLLLNKSFKLFEESEQKQILNSIVQVNSKFENTYYPGKCYGTFRGLQKYELLSQLEIDDIKKFGYFKVYQELHRKFPWYKFKKPFKSNGASFVGTPLSSDIYSKMSLNNWLQSMKVFDGTKTRTGTDFFLRGGKTEHHRQFEKEVMENPNKFFDFLVQLKSENIHPDYLSAGLNGLLASSFNEEKIFTIVTLYSDVDNHWLKRTILKAIKYLIDKNKFDVSLIDILEANKDIKFEGVVREENKFQTIHDHMSSSINSFEGEFAELLPLVYKHVFEDKNARKRVLDLINEVVTQNIDFVIFGLLRTIGNIDTVDKLLFAKLLVDLIEKDKIGQISIYSLQNFHYLYMNELVSKEQVVDYIRKCISFAKRVKDKEDSRYINNLGMYLYFYYLNENDDIFGELLNQAIDSNNQVVHGILHQIFEQELHSKDEDKVKKSKEFILRFKNDQDNDYFYTLSLTKMNGLNFIQNDFEFVKSLVSSLNIKREVKSFIEYLQNEYHSDTNISEKIFELLEELIQNIDSIKDAGYYDSRPLIEFILELNTRARSNDKKVEILNLIDRFLESDTLRFSTKSAIE